MHSVKILPLPAVPVLPCHRCSPYWTVVSCLPRRPHPGPSASQPHRPLSLRRIPRAGALGAAAPPSPHSARRYRDSCVMAGARNVQRSFVGVG